VIKTGLVGVEVLVGLGLSNRQARVYLALLKIGDAKARRLAGFTSIERQEVYRLLGELEQMGLVKRCLTVPTRFSAVPISEGTGRLIEHRLTELNLLTKRAMSLSKKLSQIQRSPPQDTPSFGVVSEAESEKNYQAAIEKAQHRLQAVMGWVQFRQFCFLFDVALLEAVKRGVAVEVLTQQPPRHCLPAWVKSALVSYPNFKLKTAVEPPSAAFCVFDGVQAVVAFSPDGRLARGLELWTGHSALVGGLQALFWGRWDKC
jgi:sugar-specific transcriptional regulator TrmB